MKSDFINASSLMSAHVRCLPASCRPREKGYRTTRRTSPLKRIARFATGLGLAVILWSAGAVLAWRILHLRGYGSVEYPSVALPWRWPEAVRAQGEDLIFRGQLLALNGGGEDAIELIAQGAKLAGNQDGYLLLARILASRHEDSNALDWLLQGLNCPPPSRIYVQTLVDLARAQDDAPMLSTVLHELWRSGWGETNPDDRLWLATEYARILQERGARLELLAWSAKWPAGLNSDSGLLHYRTEALLATGSDSPVLDLLRNRGAEGSRATVGDLPSLVEYYMHRGDVGLANRALQLGLTLAMHEPQSLLRLLEAADKHAALRIMRQNILEEYIRRFSRDEDRLVRLVQIVGTHGSVSELLRLHDLAKTAGFAEGPFLFPLIHALLDQGQIDAVQRLVPEADRQNWSQTELARLNALQHLLAEFLTEDPLMPLKPSLDQLPAEAALPDILGVATFLYRTKRPVVAQELLALAQSRFPHSAQLRNALRQLATGNLSSRKHPEFIASRS